MFDFYSGSYDPFLPEGGLPERGLGYYSGGGGGGGGGGGNRGGGSIKLQASNSLKVTGTLNTKGRASATGNGGGGQNSGDWCGGNGGGGGSAASSSSSSGGGGGNGEWRCYCEGGYGGGGGGAGAGGGIALICDGPFGVVTSGTLDTRGGGNSTSNFGSTKVFGVMGTLSLGGNKYTGWNGAYGSPYNPQNKNWVHPVC